MELTNEIVQKTYRRHSLYYDWVFGPVLHGGRKTAIDHVHCRPGQKILEVGVGTGISLPMYPASAKVTGIDLSEEMLAKARERVRRERLTQVEDLIHMDAQTMTFPDDAFDKVVAMYVASVVPNPVLLVNEIKRVCKPGGKIIFLNHFRSRNPVLRTVEGWMEAFSSSLGFRSDFALEDFLRTTGFQVTNVLPVNALELWTVLVGYNDKKTEFLS
jgi:phosphatidylethanolamine/phosphatidyl-N-methylethanolamine N-methyltransferase